MPCRFPILLAEIYLTMALRQAPSMDTATKVRVIPKKGRGKGEFVPLDTKTVSS